MKILSALFIGLFLLANSIFAQDQKYVKNVIMMIPDGTSTAVLSLARWYKNADNKGSFLWLAVDKYICGLVKTHSVNAPIGDSAPTGSTYATGYLSQTGFVATYPPPSKNDLIKVNPAKAFQPMFTILEAAKLNGKSTGLVVTCHFPHATPADFSAHTPHRDQMFPISKQMVYNKLNVVFAGGTNYLLASKRNDKEDLQLALKNRNYKLVNNLNELKTVKSTDTLVWGTFADEALPNDIDRDQTITPSLAEMTEKALDVLSTNPKGFFLMVEGSKVDWAAHNNDPIGIITEFLAFDKAVDVALNFAKKNGNTAVVICPDHGNSGVTIGNTHSNKSYDELSLSEIMKPLKACKNTAEGFYYLLMKTNPPTTSTVKEVFKTNYGVDTVTAAEVKGILDAVNNPYLMGKVVAKIISSRTYVGFTTYGHTAEDVFLSIYHPANYRPTGEIQNDSINHYMCSILGLPKLDQYTEEYYCPDSVVFNGFSMSIDTMSLGRNYPILKVNNPKTGKNMSIQAYTDNYTLSFDNQKRPSIIKQMPSVAVFVNYKNTSGKTLVHRFYVYKGLRKELE